MTTKSIKDPDFMHWQVRDLDTGKLVKHVVWANDDIGRAVVRKIVRKRGDRIVTRRLVWGNFRLEDKREKDSP